MDGKPNRRYGALLLEMFSVMIAIVLGFAVTSWNDARRDRERASAAVDRMRSELQANRGVLEDQIPYHTTIAASVDSLIRARGDGPFDLGAIPAWGGLRPPQLRTAAFELSVAAGALENVDMDDAAAIALAYEAIRDQETATDQLVSAMLNGNLERFSDVRMGLYVLAELGRESRCQILDVLVRLDDSTVEETCHTPDDR